MNTKIPTNLEATDLSSLKKDDWISTPYGTGQLLRLGQFCGCEEKPKCEESEEACCKPTPCLMVELDGGGICYVSHDLCCKLEDKNG